jgi:hypothetical protein
VRGVVLGVDRGNDLGAIRVAGPGLPEPLTLGSADKLAETQDVYIFGFPLARQIGNAITVSKSSVSSLRRDKDGLKQVQVNGGMHPGNSGGPVTDTDGQVIGVAVSGIKSTQIHFAVPGEQVRAFLNGRLDVFAREPAYKTVGRLRMPLVVTLIDPLGKVQGVRIECWTGPAGKSPPPDGNKEMVALTYDRKGTASGEITLPAAADPKHVFWWKATVTDGAGTAKVLGPFGRPLHMLVDRRPVSLKFKPAPGALNQVDLTSNATLRLRDSDGDEGTLKSNLSTSLSEQADAEPGDGGATRFRSRYTKLNIGLWINDKLIKGDEEDKKAFRDFRHVVLESEMDADGGPTTARADLAKVPESSKELINDVSEQVLQSLTALTAPLPGETLQPLQTWKVQRLLLVGPLGMGIPSQADLKYKYLGVRSRNGKDEVMIDIKGGLRGQRDRGAVAGDVTGLLALSSETGQVIDGAVTFKVDVDLLVKQSRVKANGQLSVSLKRGAPAPAKK